MTLPTNHPYFFYLPLVWLQADFRIQRCEG